MKISEIDKSNITKEIIKSVLFNLPEEENSEIDCAIIFGCHIKRLMDERLKVAIDFFKENNIGKIILSGGIGVNGDYNESEYMESYLLNHGIQKENIIIENKSTTTEENVINCIEVLKKIKLLENKNILLISNEAHLTRIRMDMLKNLKGYNYRLFYLYPKASYNSYESIISSPKLTMMAENEIKKIMRFIDDGIIDDEKIITCEKVRQK